jgi:uncharacterized protein YndB with AHSA1/START domain
MATTGRNSPAKEPAEPGLVITRVFDAPRDRVFKAWPAAQDLVQWWGPKGITTPFCKIDLRPGGVTHFCMRPPEGRDIWCGGVCREVVEPSLLVFTDYFADEKGNPVPPAHYGMSPDFPSEALITVTFAEHEGKTKLTLQQSIPESVAARHGAQQGWTESFTRHAEYLAKA